MFKNLRIKLKEREYRKYIEEHRQNVRKAFTEICMCPDLKWIVTYDLSCKLFKRIENHDLSKYSEEEFNAYRKYHYPINYIEKCSVKEDFDKAWEHHWKTNDHHWQARQNMKEEMTEEIELACLENICDWLAMGYKFNDRPIQYYNKHKDEIILPKIQINFMERVMLDLEKTKIDINKNGII